MKAVILSVLLLLPVLTLAGVAPADPPMEEVTLDWLSAGLGLLSLLAIGLSFVGLPFLGPVALLLGLSSGVFAWIRRRKHGRKNWRTAIGLWAGLPAILVFLVTLGLILFF